MRQHGQQQQLSAFELERQQRIAENKAKMMEIGVDDARDQLLATHQAQKQAKAANKPRPQRKEKPAEPARRSERTAGKERPDYRGQQELAIFVERQAKLRAPKRERAGGKQRDSNSRYPAWHEGIPDAPTTAVEEALAAASELAEQLTDNGTPAYIKVMTDSMVCRGGWLQAPSELQQHYCADSDITFTTPDTTRPASAFRYTQSHRREGDSREDAWTVGFLQKKNLKTGKPQGGYGFSKNWKGFAADQFLHPGDSVVFQVSGPFEAVVHIFRAWDYAAEASKPQGFEAIRFSKVAVVATSGADGDAAAAAADDEEEDGSEAEEAGSAAGDDASEQDDDTTTADQQKQVGKRSKSSSSKSKQQETAAAAAGKSKAGKRKAAGTAATAADSAAKRQRSSSGCSKGTKRPAAAAAAQDAAAPSKKQKQEQQKPTKVQLKQAKPVQQKKQQKKVKQQQKQEDEEEVFAVDWILGTKVIGGVRVFKVRWLGYGADYDTWEPAEMFGGEALTYDWGHLQANGNIKRIDTPTSLEY